MIRKIYSHLWIIIIVLFIAYLIMASIAEYGIIDVAKVLMAIGTAWVTASSLIMWLLSFHDEEDNEILGYQPKGCATDEHEHHNK